MIAPSLILSLAQSIPTLRPVERAEFFRAAGRKSLAINRTGASNF